MARVRVRIEGLFSMGLPNTPLHNTKIHVLSGNLVTARPFGVVDGVDHLFTGRVRRIHSERIHQMLNERCIVLLSPLGYSPSGEAFNLSSEELATDVAIELGADKLITFDSRLGCDRRRRRADVGSVAERTRFVARYRDVRRHDAAATDRIAARVSRRRTAHASDRFSRRRRTAAGTLYGGRLRHADQRRRFPAHPSRNRGRRCRHRRTDPSARDRRCAGATSARPARTRDRSILRRRTRRQHHRLLRAVSVRRRALRRTRVPRHAPELSARCEGTRHRARAEDRSRSAQARARSTVPADDANARLVQGTGFRRCNGRRTARRRAKRCTTSAQLGRDGEAAEKTPKHVASRFTRGRHGY